MPPLDDIDARLKARFDRANAIVGNDARSAAVRHPAAPADAAPAMQGGAQQDAVRQNGARPQAPRAPFSPIDVALDAAGLEKPKGFSFAAFFREVFKHHSDEDVEAIFSCGNTATPPPASRIEAAWPTPWVFGKMLLLSVVVFIAFVCAMHIFTNTNLLPGLIFVGSFAVPFATLILFFELNVWRDISLYEALKAFLVGGIVSLAFSLVFFRSGFGTLLGSAFGASSAGLIEETGKLLALAFVANTRKRGHILGGLLLGAAVGTGFSVFESAGYAMRAMMSDGSLNLSAIVAGRTIETVKQVGLDKVNAIVNESGMGSFLCGMFGMNINDLGEGMSSLMASKGLPSCESIIIGRGLLSPFGHIVWTAIAGAALWRAKGAGELTPSAFFNRHFLRVLGLSVVLHMIWNCGLGIGNLGIPGAMAYLLYYAKYLVLGAIGWICVLSFEQEGLREVISEKRGALAAVPTKRMTVASMLLSGLAFVIVTFFTGFLIAAGGAFFSRVVLPAIAGS